MGFITIGVSGSEHEHPAIEWGVEYATAHDVRIDIIGDELSQLMVEQSRKTRSDISDSSPEEVAAIAAAALRPPPDDPRRGLIALLGREHAGRRTAYARFRELWDTYGADGMRRDLVELSITPLLDRRDDARTGPAA